MLAEFTLKQQILIEFLKALFTSVLVAGLAALVVGLLQRKSDARRADRERELQAQIDQARADRERELQAKGEAAKAERDRSWPHAAEAQRILNDLVTRSALVCGTFYFATQAADRQKSDPGKMANIGHCGL